MYTRVYLRVHVQSQKYTPIIQTNEQKLLSVDQ